MLNNFAMALLFVVVFAGITQAGETFNRAQAAAILSYEIVTSRGLFRDEVEKQVQPDQPTPAKEPMTYKEAYELYRNSQRPMVVMLTADWCPNCGPVKRKLEKMKRDGFLDMASVVYVNIDSEPQTGRSVAQRARYGIPLVACYYWKNGRQWRKVVSDTAEIPGILAD